MMGGSPNGFYLRNSGMVMGGAEADPEPSQEACSSATNSCRSPPDSDGFTLGSS